MSFIKSSNWHRNNFERRGRGGRGRGRGGFGEANRGAWGRNHHRGPPQYGNKGWGDWSHDYRSQGNQQWQNKPKKDAPEKRLSEEDIGVTEFVSDHEGFGGIIKSSISDLVGNLQTIALYCCSLLLCIAEINEDGEVAELTDVTAPTPVDDKFDEDEDLLFTKYNLEILPMNTWDNINKLVVTKEDPTAKVEIDVTGMSKEQRTKIHDAVKKAFGDSIVGSTVNEGDKKIVRFVRYRKGVIKDNLNLNSSSSVRIDNRVKWTWPGEYVYFIVYKENCDTMDAAARIAENLRINMKASLVGYAGSKDRRAKTSQWFSVRRVDP
ncbi:unnamed protein product [Diatraea saccharalis]|uniref:Uncharacterized protein n=1 Tax=Diatraea saccharalis TaxID=40085 RepID=A0A9N9W7Y8_9NEOP|nr:unnamed protein product [Diatraea saccharalis]